jgi:hypothetical protein
LTAPGSTEYDLLGSQWVGPVERGSGMLRAPLLVVDMMVTGLGAGRDGRPMPAFEKLTGGCMLSKLENKIMSLKVQ